MQCFITIVLCSGYKQPAKPKVYIIRLHPHKHNSSIMKFQSAHNNEGWIRDGEKREEKKKNDNNMFRE